LPSFLLAFFLSFLLLSGRVLNDLVGKEIEKRMMAQAKLALGCWPKPSGTRMLGRTSQHSDARPDQPAPDAG
jgi:hypothetical protein